jgi:hypothetical protein
MVVSTDVDVSSLQEAFDLQTYDGFLPADVYEGLQSAARETIAMRKVSTRTAQYAASMDGSICKSTERHLHVKRFP